MPPNSFLESEYKLSISTLHCSMDLLAVMDIEIVHEEIVDNNENEYWEFRYPQMMLEARDIEIEPLDLSLELRIILRNVVVPCPFCGFKETSENQVKTRQATRVKSRHENNCRVIRD